MGILPELRIALIGAGAMGEAIINGLLQQGIVHSEQIMVSEPRVERRQELQSCYKTAICDSNQEAVQWANLIIFAIKPQILPQVLPPLRNKLPAESMGLSIAAGVPLKTFTTSLDHHAMVRAMPNTPAQVGEAMTVWTTSIGITEQQRSWAKAVLASLGQELFVPDEHTLDMATAINGSGPAYIFLMLEAMIDAAVHLGFSRQVAQQLVYQTMLGSVSYAMQSDQHLAQLRNSVTSPGGTTAAALNVLERNGLRSALSDAMWAAYHRSCELGRKD